MIATKMSIETFKYFNIQSGLFPNVKVFTEFQPWNPKQNVKNSIPASEKTICLYYKDQPVIVA